jgi:hypothetical protein
MKKPFVVSFLLLIVVGVLAVATGQSRAQDGSPVARVAAAGSDYIPVQGRLTDASGNPLNGNYNVVFRLYDVGSGGSTLCQSTNNISLVDGLFTTYMNAAGCPIDGRQLYLGIQVGSDPEMTPRQYIDNVPYAWSLRPGAVIEDERDDFVVRAENAGTGAALLGQTISASPNSIGVKGTSVGGSGIKGDSLAGIGVEASSFSGVAFKATGTGVVQSTANSYVWLSGNGVRPYRQNDSTIIDMTSIGGARIYRGGDAGNKNVMLPIVIPGQLYGQNVTVTGMDIYWAGDTDFDAISAILLRRQTGVCGSSACYDTILYSTTDRTCEDGLNPTGCTVHFNLSANNELSASSGALYLTLELSFSGATTWIDIGGIRLMLAHE